MNLIFITIAYPNHQTESNLYSDLMDEFALHGHKVHVACIVEKRFGQETHVSQNGNISVLRVKTGNITSNPNYIRKGLALLKLQSQLIRAIKKFYSSIEFDLILYSTPPIQYNRVIKTLKSGSNAKTYLLLKDIFPQNAIDLGLFARWNPLYHYFKRKERQTYLLSDFIGCMSPANVNYLKAHYPYLKGKSIEVSPNSLKLTPEISAESQKQTRQTIRERYNILPDDIWLVYGGNLGISQGVSFLLEILKHFANHEKVKFLIAGEGTWFPVIENFLVNQSCPNTKLIKKVPTVEFKQILLASDIGLIFLNPKFTIPNFPSRLTSYLEAGLPVIACTDSATDVGEIVENAGCGYKILSGDLAGFSEAVNSMIERPENLKKMSENARKLFETSYTTFNTYASVIKHFNND